MADSNPNRELLLKTLQVCGPLPAAEICELTGLKRRYVIFLISQLMGKKFKGRAQLPRQVRVIKWELDDLNGTSRYYPRALYGIGVGHDARKPQRLTGSETTRRYRNKKAMVPRTIRNVPNSVFNLG